MKRYELNSIPQIAKWLWKYWKCYKYQAILNAAIGLLLVVSSLAFVWTTKLCIDIVTHKESVVSLQTAIIILISISFFQLLLGIGSKWIKATLGVRSQNGMRQAVFDKLILSEWNEVRQFHTGDLLNRIEQDVRDVTVFLTENIPSLFTTTFQLLGAFFFLYWMEKTLACAIILIVPFFVICSKLYIRKMRRMSHEVREKEGKIQSYIQENLQHLTVIKTLERDAETIAGLGRKQTELQKIVIEKTTYSTISSTLTNVGFSIGYLVTFIWGIKCLQRGEITYGTMLAFIQLVGQIQLPIRNIVRFVPRFISAFTSSERLMKLERIPDEIHTEKQQINGAAGISIENLTFSYGEKENKILDRFCYCLPPRGILVIQGTTGAGKTTLMRILLSLIPPTAGTLFIYNEEGEKIPISTSTRCNFSYVPQGNTLFSGTIRENLLMGNPYATEQEIKEAVRQAAAGFIYTLPNGMDTVCGEMGYGLSEGQAQRIAIARALLKRCAFLLFDEATSALDETTEREILNNIITHQKDKTLIFVTHRPEVLKYATHSIML